MFCLLQCFLKIFKILHEKAVRDMDLLNSRLTKLQQDYQNQIDAADALATDNQNKAAELKVGLQSRLIVDRMFFFFFFLFRR